jgi:hypothetical protein
MKRKPVDVLGQPPWEIEIDYFIAQGCDPGWARAIVINSWMYAGDLRPLRAEIGKSPGPELDKRVVVFIAKMIDEDRLAVKSKRLGAGSSPEKLARMVAVAYLYKEKISEGKRSDYAFEEVADQLGMTSDNARKLWTQFYKNWADKNGK